MALIKPKTRKAIVKPIRKLIKKHGSAVTIELITSIVASLANDDTDKTAKKMKKKLKKAQKNGNFVTEAAAGIVTNLVSTVISNGNSKKLKQKSADSDNNEQDV